MPEIPIEPTATAEWRALVQSAGSACGTALSEPVEAYLVFMLMRFSQRIQVGRRPLALDFLRGLQSPRTGQGARRLRDTGDECLLVCGLFPQRVRRRRVSCRYYVDLGRGAYGTLAQAGADSDSEPFGALARGFVGLMELLQAMRARRPEQDLDPLDAAELAQQTGSRAAWDRVAPADTTLMPHDADRHRH